MLFIFTTRLPSRDQAARLVLDLCACGRFHTQFLQTDRRKHIAVIMTARDWVERQRFVFFSSAWIYTESQINYVFSCHVVRSTVNRISRANGHRNTLLLRLSPPGLLCGLCLKLIVMPFDHVRFEVCRLL